MKKIYVVFSMNVKARKKGKMFIRKIDSIFFNRQEAWDYCNSKTQFIKGTRIVTGEIHYWSTRLDNEYFEIINKRPKNQGGGWTKQEYTLFKALLSTIPKK